MTIARFPLLAAGVTLMVALPLAAQNPTDSTRARQRPPIGVEEALRLRSELELNAQQIERLEALRRQWVEARATRAREMTDLSSRLRAGDLTRAEFRSRIEARRDSLRAGRNPRTDPVAGILTDAQRQKAVQLRRDTMRREIRRGMRGRGPRGVGRGRMAPRVGPGFRRSPGGRGVGPGMGPRFRFQDGRGMRPRMRRPRVRRPPTNPEPSPRR